MVNNLTSQKFLPSDGTTQSQRLADALAPGYAVPDARSTADLLALAQKYARFIRFFGENNEPLGTWEAFLPGQAPGAAGEPAALPPGQWLADISAYLRDPQSLTDRPELQQRLSRPHLALFLTFLQLLEPIREQLNGFTGRHLAYYYRQVLGLTTANAVPDLAHVIVALAAGVDHLLVPQGTALLAGKDSLGKNLVYRVVKDTGISRARLQRSAKLFVDKELLTLKSIREAAAAESDAGFLRMMQFAHGFLRPTAEPYPTKPATYLTSEGLEASSKQLFISRPDADFLFALQGNSKNGQASSTQWEKAYFILEQALKDKTIADRQQALKKFRESAAKPLYENLLWFTFGVLGLQAARPAAPPAAPGPAARPLVGLSDEELHDLAKAYLTERELQLVRNTTKAASEASAKDWDGVYVALERAARKQGNRALPVPMQERWGNVYACANAREAGAAPLAHLGFAVASPQLALAEGERKLTLTCAFQAAGAAALDALQPALAARPTAISWALSSPKGWLEVAPPKPPQFGHFVIGSAAWDFEFAVPKSAPTDEEKAKFTAADRGKYLVAKDKTIYLLTADPAPGAKVSLLPQGKASGQPAAGLYYPAQVYLHAMQVQFVRQATDPPVAAPGAPDAAWPLQSDVPVLALRLNQAQPAASARKNQDEQNQEPEDVYQLFRKLKLNRLKVEVAVTGIRTLRLQNDYGALNGKKPFEPFGPSPQAGNSLYLAHPELSSKRLDSLTLMPQWMGAPADFGAYYENYWKIRGQKAVAPEDDIIIKGNGSFTATLRLVDQQLEDKNQPVTLFGPAASWRLAFAGGQASRQDPDGDEADLLDWNRYFQLELASPDFQHAAYSELLVQQAFLDAKNDLRKLPLRPPYTPLLKALTADYTASFEVAQGGGGAGTADQVLHLGAFGYKALTLAPTTPFLPFPAHRSELLLGLSAVDTPQILPLFFQLADATTQPDLTPGPLAWSYLANNEWQPLGEAAVVSDTTNGLLQTGILELQLPAAPASSTTANTWLPQGLYWLKAGFEAPMEAVPAIIDVQAQGLQVRFDDQGNAADHLLAPLPPDSITKPLADIPAIAKLRQPYPSAGGRPAETAAVFHNRVSERVRHKNRALTAWDYERLVLEGFPQIYKAKCLPAAGAPGSVDLLVIPDVRGNTRTAPPEPRASAALLLQIRQFVAQRAPAYAAIQVKNPSYMRVKVRAAVKIRPGYGEAQAVRELETDLKRYLAPWAYEEGMDIIVGGRLYPDMIVNFIAGKSYVEFAASVLLFLSADGEHYLPVEQMIGGSNGQSRTLPPEFILVSAPEHVFDIIRESRFEERLLTGVGYAKIGLDFTVG